MITEKFPFLLPLRVAQRKAFFYAGMRFDGRKYARILDNKPLGHKMFSSKGKLYNPNTGFDMVYQENKVFNLKLVARKVNGLLIKPGETFSFWQAVRHADKYVSYKDGLVVKNGKLCVSGGGGLCQISNLLFWVFLHSPLSIVERHTHRVKDFPTLRGAEPEGVDATISEGWLDLKVKNETDMTFQLRIAFDDENIIGGIFTDKPPQFAYEIDGRDMFYFRKNNLIYEKISIYRQAIALGTEEISSEELLYENISRIGYRLPAGTPIIEKGADLDG